MRVEAINNTSTNQRPFPFHSRPADTMRQGSIAAPLSFEECLGVVMQNERPQKTSMGVGLPPSFRA